MEFQTQQGKSYFFGQHYHPQHTHIFNESQKITQNITSGKSESEGVFKLSERVIGCDIQQTNSCTKGVSNSTG